MTTPEPHIDLLRMRVKSRGTHVPQGHAKGAEGKCPMSGRRQTGSSHGVTVTSRASPAAGEWTRSEGRGTALCRRRGHECRRCESRRSAEAGGPIGDQSGLTRKHPERWDPPGNPRDTPRRQGEREKKGLGETGRRHHTGLGCVKALPTPLEGKSLL